MNIMAACHITGTWTLMENVLTYLVYW